jgi:hypothetical protein
LIHKSGRSAFMAESLTRTACAKVSATADVGSIESVTKM